MARVSYIELEAGSPEVREIYETTLRGKPGSVQKILAHRPAMLKAFLAFYASVGRSLERRLYEMVYIRVSMINGCRYCLQHHLAGSKRVGVTSEEWARLNAGEYSGFTATEQAALKFAEKLTRESRNIADADIAELKALFTEEQIVDLDMLVGLANLTNRFTDPLGADLEFPEEKIPT
ncbi:MAG TPA: carboxymuconolactone decarboxylase family protein [Terriglobales bacterium]